MSLDIKLARLRNYDILAASRSSTGTFTGCLVRVHVIIMSPSYYLACCNYIQVVDLNKSEPVTKRKRDYWEAWTRWFSYWAATLVHATRLNQTKL